MSRYRTSLVIVLAVAFALSIAPVVAQEGDAGPARVGLRPDAPTYAVHGPYWVGTREFVIEEGGERPLPVSVWYPALNPEGSPEEIKYPADLTRFAEIPKEVAMIVEGHALKDALPDGSSAPYPLVIFSHGFSALGPTLWAYLTEHVASWGFVVVAPYHLGDVPETFDGSTVTRLLEVRRAIAYADALTAQDGILAGVINTDKIAVMGHSAGGITSYGAAGAPMNWSSLEAACALITDGSFPCADMAADKAAMLAAAGLETEPEGLWPAIWDPRVDAIIPISADLSAYGQEGLAEITVPALIMYGSADTLFVSPEYVTEWMHPGYDYVSSTQKARVVLEDAGHAVFIDDCTSMTWVYSVGLSPVCSDSVWDMERAHDLTDHLVTAFLLDVLKGDAEAHAALLPDAVSFPGITYETTMR